MPSYNGSSSWWDVSVPEPSWLSLPFPQSWGFDENGIQLDWQDHYESTWVINAEQFRLIPFWHEAE